MILVMAAVESVKEGKSMLRIILILCLWPFLLPIWIIRGLFTLIGGIWIGSEIDDAIFGKH